MFHKQSIFPPCSKLVGHLLLMTPFFRHLCAAPPNATAAEILPMSAMLNEINWHPTTVTWHAAAKIIMSA